MYDSRPETIAHIECVYHNSVQFSQVLLATYPSLFTMCFCWRLLEQVKGHDASKLAEPELGYLNRRDRKLAHVEYGSKEYTRLAEQFLPGIRHHVRHNPHHPEFWAESAAEVRNGIAIRRMPFSYEMEMLMDWEAAGRRLRNGSFQKSIVVNQKRFGFDDDQAELYASIGRVMGWIDDTS